MRLISVKDRLPECCEYVLIRLPDGAEKESQYHRGIDWWSNIDPDEYPTHWQPLPDPTAALSAKEEGR